MVKASTAGTFSIAGLPGDVYGVKYTTAAEYDVDVPDVAVLPGGRLTARIPSKGVLTVYRGSAAGVGD